MYNSLLFLLCISLAYIQLSFQTNYNHHPQIKLMIRRMRISRVSKSSFYMEAVKQAPALGVANHTSNTDSTSYSVVSTHVENISPECPAGYVEWKGVCITYDKHEYYRNNRCPTGYIQLGSACYFYVQPQCKPGYKLLDKICTRSVTDVVSTGVVENHKSLAKRLTPICPTGYQYYMKACAKFAADDSKYAYHCPNGYQRSQGHCVIWKTAKCPENYLFNADECVLKEFEVASQNKIACPTGYEVYGNICYQNCPVGYKRHYSNLCISSKSICPMGYDLNERNICVRKSCPEGMELDSNNYCTEKCPEGFSPFYKLCITSKDKCPENYKKEGRFCIPLSCPKGSVLEKDVCVARFVIQCPEHYELDGQMCRFCQSGSVNDCQKYDYKCPSGWYKLSEKECAQSCPPGTAALGLHCVTISRVGCPEGFLHIENQGGCVKSLECPKNYKLVGRECIYEEIKEVDTVDCKNFFVNGQCLDRCPSGFIGMDHGCFRLTQTHCPEGLFELENKYCVLNCPAPLVANYETRKCTLKKGHCKEGQFYLDRSCANSCPRFTIADAESRVCLVKENLCRSGEYYMYGNCINEAICKQTNMIPVPHQGICIIRRKCGENQKQFGLYCIDHCPLGYEAFQRNICEAYVDDKCPRGVWHNDKCIDKCPENHVARFGQCVGDINSKPFTPEIPNKNNETTKVELKCGNNMEVVKCSDDENCEEKCSCKSGFELVESGDYCLEVPLTCTNSAPLDIAFVTDGGNSTGSDLSKIKAFVKASLNKIYGLKKEYVRIGSVHLSKNQIQILYIDNKQKQCDVEDAIEKLDKEDSADGVTNSGSKGPVLSEGLRVVREFVFSQCNGARTGASRLIFVISPQVQHYSKSEHENIVYEATLNQQQGNRIAFITVGDIENLPDSAYVIPTKSVDGLAGLEDRTARIICNTVNCPSGYHAVNNTCQDINECSKSPCFGNSVCINEPGTFKCYCEPGKFYKDHKVGCLEEKEKCNAADIRPEFICDVVQCVGDAKCSSHNGHGFCVCQQGYVYDAVKGCVDHNECDVNPCLDNAMCSNTNGSFSCSCENGYTYHKHFGCVDIDECKTESNPCSGNGECKNTIGGYECSCKAGYEYDLTHGCSDVNECELNNSLCIGEQVTCTNLPGSYECTCKEGYTYSEAGCRDINECTESNGPQSACGEGATCINEEPGYICACDDGYIHDSKLNKCVLDPSQQVIERKARMGFVMDVSKEVQTGEMFNQQKETILKIIESYINLADNIKVDVTATGIGGLAPTSNPVFFEHESLNKANESLRQINAQGGEASIREGLTQIRSIVNKGNSNDSSEIIYLFTATTLPRNNPGEMDAIKSLISEISQHAKLFIVGMGNAVNREDWKSVLTGQQLNKNFFIMTSDFWQSLYKVLYTNSIGEVVCPNGFVLLGSVCQYKSSVSTYCTFNDQLYAIGTTWSEHCAKYECTESGVSLLEKKCLGFDGDCYEEGEFFPAFMHGRLEWQTQCKVVTHTDSQTNKITQRITYISVKFDQEAASKAAATEDDIACSFPFKYYGYWYYSCTKSRSSTRWCSHNHIYNSRYYSYCKNDEKQQCVVNGKIYEEGEIWSKGCNELLCDAGAISVTSRCSDADGKCVALLTSGYDCMINGERKSNCICVQNSLGYGHNSLLGGESVDETNHSVGMVSYCRNPITGEEHEIGAEWVDHCFKLQCNEGGNVTILSKGCEGSDSTCKAIDADSTFKCVISEKNYDTCRCLQSQNSENNVLMVAEENGKRVAFFERSGPVTLKHGSA